MSAFQFAVATVEQALVLLEYRHKHQIYQAESYPDALDCQRRLERVTTDAELAENRAYLAAQRERAEDAKWGGA